MASLEDYLQWNKVTGVPAKGSSWDYELQSMFEDADKRIELLATALQKHRAHWLNEPPPDEDSAPQRSGNDNG